MKPILYFSVATSFLATNLFAFSVGPFQMSLYRLSLLGSLLFFVFFALGKGANIRFSLEVTRQNHPQNINAERKGNGFLEKKASSTYPVWFMIIWFVWALASSLWVKDFSLWLKAMYFLGTGTWWAVCYSIFFIKEKDFRIIFNLMQTAIFLVGLIGWYEVFTKDYKFIEMTPANIHAFVNAPARVPIALSGNPNDFALLVLIGIFISYICLQTNKGIFGKSASLIAMLSSAGLLFFTESRANLLGLILGLGVFVMLSFKDKKRMALMVLLGGGALGLFMTTPYWDILLEKITQVMQFQFKNGSYNSESVRVNLIINGLYFLVETMWIGTGAGNIEYWMANHTIVNTNGYVNIHNWWVEILANYGLVIFCLYLAFYVVLFRCLLHRFKEANTRFLKQTSLGLLCCMSAFVIGSISSSSNMKTEWLWVFWGVLIAFCVRTQHHAKSEPVKTPISNLIVDKQSIRKQVNSVYFKKKTNSKQNKKNTEQSKSAYFKF